MRTTLDILDNFSGAKLRDDRLNIELGRANDSFNIYNQRISPLANMIEENENILDAIEKYNNATNSINEIKSGIDDFYSDVMSAYESWKLQLIKTSPSIEKSSEFGSVEERTKVRFSEINDSFNNHIHPLRVIISEGGIYNSSTEIANNLENMSLISDEFQKWVHEHFNDISVLLESHDVNAIALDELKRRLIDINEEWHNSIQSAFPILLPADRNVSYNSQRLLADIGGMRSVLSSIVPGFANASNISKSIIGLTDASQQLALLETTADTRILGGDGGEQFGSDANDELAEVQQNLSAAVQELYETIDSDAVHRPIALALRNDPFANQNAQTIWNQYLQLASLNWHPGFEISFQWLGALIDQPLSWHPSFEISFQRLATLSDQSLTVILVLLLGALGSLIYMTREELQLVIHRKPEKIIREMYPLPWYLFRPVFGGVIAFAIYLIYKTGQLALGSGNTGPLDSQVNIPILSVFSLFAGLLAWQTLQMIEQRGLAWLNSTQREDLYASGLERLLHDRGHTLEECAAKIGRSVEQVQRWIDGSDKATPEIQDRIATWLDVPITTIFAKKMRNGKDTQ